MEVQSARVWCYGQVWKKPKENVNSSSERVCEKDEKLNTMSKVGKEEREANGLSDKWS